MSDFYKKGFSFLCASVLLFCLTACRNPKNESSAVAATEEPEEIAVLSAESAVEIYFQNMDVWVEKPENPPMNGYGYCLLDLDFDGVLELIASVCDGSGRYSTNRIYKIDSEKQNVTLLRTEGTANPDYYYLKDKTKLLKNTADNKLFYLVAEYTRVSEREGGVGYYEISEAKGTVAEDLVFSEITTPDYENGTDEKIREFSFRGKNCSKTEYEQYLAEYYEENTDLNLTFLAIDGETFAASDDSARKDLLRNAYRGFSYDGFSFDTLKTYEITK